MTEYKCDSHHNILYRIARMSILVSNICCLGHIIKEVPGWEKKYPEKLATHDFEQLGNKLFI